MSPFKDDILKARARQRMMYLLMFLGLMLAAVIGVSVLIFANATPVLVSPDEASKTAKIKISKGLGVIVDDVVYTVMTPPEIVVTAKGYQDNRYQITTRDQGQRLLITMQELPGRMKITATPTSAQTVWSVDGKRVSMGGGIDREVKSGSYQIMALNPFYQPWQQTLEIKRGETTELKVTLKPVDGKFEINSTPDGAAVAIAGKPAGATPVTVKLPGGEYAVRVVKPGFEAINDNITISHEKPAPVRNYRLQRPSVMLSFDTRPEGGKLVLNGRVVNADGKYKVTAKTPNTVTYFMTGYIGKTAKVTLEPGKNKRFKIRLEKDMGKVVINAKPEADVYVFGKKKGKTPLQLTLPALPQVIELRKSGYISVKKTITPTSKRTTSIRENLKSKISVLRDATKKSYKNSIGMRFKLFYPTAFTMGAPRSEPGQMADEFIKKVELSRPFYASLYETTNKQYSLFSGSVSGQDSKPVINVSWIEAIRFCNWLSGKENLKPAYKIDDKSRVTFNKNANGYRLLSEAEWEWLARRAGKKRQTIFTWGDKTVLAKKTANVADETANGITAIYVPGYTDGFARAAPVGRFNKEPSGLYDMAGNVREWVYDAYRLLPPKRGQVFKDPMGPSAGKKHVVKGPSWSSGTLTELRMSFRQGRERGDGDIGFRIGRYAYADPELR